MNSPFKFLRRVRIHGGECGAVARALHHKVKGSSLYQADSGKALESTNERKQMSTKTTLKRIALVAVSALGFGMLSIVVTPSANALGISTPTAISATSVTTARAGVEVVIPVTFTMPSSTVVGTDSLLAFARVSDAPATSASVSLADNASGTGGTTSTSPNGTGEILWANGSSGSGSFGAAISNTYSSGDAESGLDKDNWTAIGEYDTSTSDTATTITLNLKFTPDVAGTYTIVVGAGSNTAGATVGDYDTAANIEAAALSALVTYLPVTTITVSTSGAPTTATLTAVTTGAPEDSAVGALYKVTLNGTLSDTEKLNLTSTSTTVTFKEHTGATAKTQLIYSDFVNGVAYFTAQNTVAETATITVTGGGLLSTSVTSSATFTTTTPTNGSVVGSITALSTSIASADTTAGTSTAVLGYWRARTTATSQSITLTGTAANVEYVTVTDTNGKATGKAGAKYDKTATIGSAGTASFSVPATLLVGEKVILTLTGTTSTTGMKTMNITGRASTATSVTVTNATRRAALAATESFVATVKDQYGAAMADQTVVVTVSGRNAAKASASYTSNASGQITHSFTDTGTAGTSDTLTFTAGSVTGTATITYGTSTAGTVTLVGPNTDDLVITYADMTDIAAGASGASATTATVTATVKDAGAALMEGMPVTFAVTGTNCAILSTKVTVYTGAAGTAATSVYKWSNGTCAVTATTGGVTSAADTVHFAQKTATEARTLAGTVAGNVITATVKDRFGNPINGAYVWASRTGGGFFANGASSTSAVTGEDGTVQFVYSTDATTAGTVKLQLGSSTAADAEYGQSAAGANLVTSPSLATDIFTATTVGTATTAETGVGASLAPAGANSVTVTVAAAVSSTQVAAEAATDAAAEAIDAANAATDAANLAAEAADAATVAAEEARDAADAATAAVEELATQVATLMAALKAQITTLANTVAKIAKKVKA